MPPAVAKKPMRRGEDFQRLFMDHQKNQLDTQIPGYSQKDKTLSYLLTIQGLDGYKVPEAILNNKDLKLSAEIHLSFFFRNMATDKQFFFGRTLRSKPFDLKLDKFGNYGFVEQEHVYFHSGLANKHAEFTHLVVECVLVTQDLRTRASRMYSIGYSTNKIFKPGPDVRSL